MAWEYIPKTGEEREIDKKESKRENPSFLPLHITYISVQQDPETPAEVTVTSF